MRKEQRKIGQKNREKVERTITELPECRITDILARLDLSKRTVYKHLKQLVNERRVEKVGKRYYTKSDLQLFQFFKKILLPLKEKAYLIGDIEKSPVAILTLPGGGLPRQYKAYELIDLIRRSLAEAILVKGKEDISEGAKAIAPKGRFFVGFLVNTDQVVKWMKEMSKEEFYDYALSAPIYRRSGYIFVKTGRR